MDLYLKAASKDDLDAALDAAGLMTTDEDGNKVYVSASHHHALDVIGVLYTRGEWDAEAEAWKVKPEPKEGYHANVRTDDPNIIAVLEALRVYPVTPDRVWA